MTAAAGHAITERTEPIPSPSGPSLAAATPRLADGVELLGEYRGSGYAQPPSLVRRPDGQVVQMSRMLYQVTCRIDGSRDPGAIGAGIYLVWPSFFTDVTDSYRLSRAGRLRTDLGGLYFNLIFILILAGIYAAAPAGFLFLVIAITHLEMLEQLLPFVRFDGYFILSDLVGVPDLFARVTPILRNAVSGGPRTRALPASGAAPGSW